jgi:hypothetical protein
MPPYEKVVRLWFAGHLAYAMWWNAAWQVLLSDETIQSRTRL